MQSLVLDPSLSRSATRKTSTHTPSAQPNPDPTPSSIQPHPVRGSSTSDASIYFVGTATTLIKYAGLTIMTDPNFLHAGDHVHLGPGVTGTRVTNPAISIEELPPVDLVLLSHYHADHFDELVEDTLRRDLPIITTPHARECLVDQKAEGEKFTNVLGVDTWQSAEATIKGRQERMRVRAMPGKHVPSGGIVGTLNDWVGAVPPTNGWMVELGSSRSEAGPREGSVGDSEQDDFECGYRIYISGDTLLVDELKDIPEQYKGQDIDLMLIHLGGTTIPSPKIPLLMVTMDAKQGVELIRLIGPDVTIPIHYDDYDVFLSPLDDFRKAVDAAGLSSKVVYLDRSEQYNFAMRPTAASK